MAVGVMAGPVEAAGVKPLGDQKVLLQQLGVRNVDGIVVDSAMTCEQALGDSLSPAGERAYHAVMKPHLRVGRLRTGASSPMANPTIASTSVRSWCTSSWS